jgi:hypothetical protein
MRSVAAFAPSIDRLRRLSSGRAAFKVDSVPERALLRAEEVDLFALSRSPPRLTRRLPKCLFRAVGDRRIAGVRNPLLDSVTVAASSTSCTLARRR